MLITFAYYPTEGKEKKIISHYYGLLRYLFLAINMLHVHKDTEYSAKYALIMANYAEYFLCAQCTSYIGFYFILARAAIDRAKKKINKLITFK